MYPTAVEGQNFPFSSDLAPGIGGLGYRRVGQALVPAFDVPACIDDTRGADVDQSGDRVPLAGGHHVLGTAVINPPDGIPVAGARLHDGGGMNDGIHTGANVDQAGGIGDVQIDTGHVPPERLAVQIDNGHVVTGIGKRLGHGGADEPAAPGNQNLPGACRCRFVPVTCTCQTSCPRRERSWRSWRFGDRRGDGRA